MDPRWESLSPYEWIQHRTQQARKRPLKQTGVRPKIPGRVESLRWLRWKSLWYMFAHDTHWSLTRHMLARPVRHLFGWLRSFVQKRPFHKEGDFYYYQTTPQQLGQLLRDPTRHLLVGLSYCHKPLECPEGRFNSRCVPQSGGVCAQCPVGALKQMSHSLTLVIVPTAHAIGAALFAHLERYPRALYLISACPLCLEMLADWGNMTGVPGVGVALTGRICNTWRSFTLSEEGVKPGRTDLHDATLATLWQWIRVYQAARDAVDETGGV